MGRKRNTAGVLYRSGGGLGAYVLLVAVIVMVVLAAAYMLNTSSPDNAGTAIGNRDRLVSAQSSPFAQQQRARAARAARARRAAVVRARIAVRRAARRRARRAALRAARRRASVTVTVVRERSFPVFSGAGQNVCAPLGPRGGGRPARRARQQRALQRRQYLYNLNLHC